MKKDRIRLPGISWDKKNQLTRASRYGTVKNVYTYGKTLTRKKRGFWLFRKKSASLTLK
jgi:hypothetical protein